MVPTCEIVFAREPASRSHSGRIEDSEGQKVGTSRQIAGQSETTLDPVRLWRDLVMGHAIIEYEPNLIQTPICKLTPAISRQPLPDVYSFENSLPHRLTGFF